MHKFLFVHELYWSIFYLELRPPHASLKRVSWIPLSNKSVMDLHLCAHVHMLAYLAVICGAPPGLVHLHSKNNLLQPASLCKHKKSKMSGAPNSVRDCSWQGTRFNTQSGWTAYLAVSVANSVFLLFSIPSVLHKPPNPGETQNLCQRNSVVSKPPVDDINAVLNTVMVVSHMFLLSGEHNLQVLFLKTPPKSPSILIASKMQRVIWLLIIDGWCSQACL